MSLDPTDEGCFSISAQSDLSKLLKRSKLLVVDEATLIDRRNFDKFEATLRDITGCSLPWGGKIVIFCGDFRSSNSKLSILIAFTGNASQSSREPAVPPPLRTHQQISPVERCPSHEAQQEHACVGQFRRHQAGRV